MFLFIDSYSIHLHPYESSQYYKTLPPVQDFSPSELSEDLKKQLEELQVDVTKPAFVKRMPGELLLLYHILGELVGYKNTLDASVEGVDQKYGDGRHPIVSLGEKCQFYFAEEREFPRQNLPQSSFSLYIRQVIV